MSVATLVERLEQLAVDQLDAGGVAGRMRDLQRVKGFVAEVEHALARRADELAEAGSGAPASEVLGRTGNCSPREAARVARRAETLGEMPTLSTQLRKGRIGTEHADAIATVAGRLDGADRAALLSLDDELAVTAASSTPAQFRRHVERVADQLAADRGIERAERQRRATTLSTGIDDQTGMYWLRGEFDPESGARLFRAIDAETRSLASRAAPRPDAADTPPRSQLAAHALVGLVTSAARSRRPGRTELLALVDLDTIVNGLRADSTCELDDGTELPVETIRRLACDAHIIPVVLDGEGVPLDLGRSRRLASDDQRRALRAMYRTCGIGECDVPFDECEIHHVDEWDAHDGKTDLARLIPGCSRHHHLVHEGRWQLELDPVTRELTITLPDGTELCRSRPHSVTAPTVGRAA
ncbi:MAG TPA: DUF222 domain-containing protein [Ilumatobacteraceae bacterium]|nr:DUF222 domain-containing protein [Ilumatobacteraceae bacterium]